MGDCSVKPKDFKSKTSNKIMHGGRTPVGGRPGARLPWAPSTPLKSGPGFDERGER